MIKNIAHAARVQNRRFYQSKKGVAKAVRRFLVKNWWRTGKVSFGVLPGMQANFDNCRRYDEVHIK